MVPMPVQLSSTCAIGPFHLDPVNKCLTRDGDRVLVPGKAFEVLACLVANPGRLVTREELLAEVWPGETVDENNVSAQIGALRRVFGTDPDYIETVPRRGYRFIGPVTPVGPAAPPADADLQQPRTLRALRVVAAAALGAIVLGTGYWFAQSAPPLPPPPPLTPADAPPGARCCNVGVTLPSGLTLVAGGTGEGIRLVGELVGTRLVTRPQTVEYDPFTVRMQIVERMHVERESASATLLADGRVLFAGGWGCAGDTEPYRVWRETGFATATYCLASKRRPLDAAEIYDPATKSFTLLDARMPVARAGHTATLLNDGTVLMVGGHTGTDDWGTHVDLFDPTHPGGPTFRSLAPLSTALLEGANALECRDCRGSVRKADHTATLLADGTVLIAGGWRGSADAQVFPGALRYRPGDAGLTLAHPTGAPYVRAAGATATLVSDGRVVFAGGHRDHHVPGSLEAPLATTLIHDPTTGRTVAGPSLGERRVGHTATVIHNDTIIIAGGMPCPFSYTDVLAHGPHHPDRQACAATTSADVLTVRPTPRVRTTTAMARGRAYFTAAWLRDGGDRVLFMGGLTSPGVTTSISEVADFSRWIALDR